MSILLSLWLSSVPPVAYRSVRQFAVPPWNSCAVVALGLEASILPLRDLNSSSVRSLVQHSAEAAVVRVPEESKAAGENFTVHFSASGVTRMLVVVCKSHWSWRQTSAPSLVKVTSHSRMPAPMRASVSCAHSAMASCEDDAGNPREAVQAESSKAAEPISRVTSRKVSMDFGGSHT